MYSAIKKSFASEIESKVEAQARAKAAKRNAMGLLVVVVVLILLLGVSVAANAAIMIYVVDDAKETSVAPSTGVLGDKSTGNPVLVGVSTNAEGVLLAPLADAGPVRVAVAAKRLPLVVAPMLSQETLAEVTALQISYSERVGHVANVSETIQRNISASYTVTGFDWETNTRMNFTTSRGDIVQLHDGRAYLHKFHRNVDADFEYRRFHLCESNVKCSAIESVLSDDIAVEEMLNRSIEAAAEAAEAADVELMRKHEDAPLHSVRPLTDREQEFVDACPGFSHEYLVDTVDGFSELWEHASLYEQNCTIFIDLDAVLPANQTLQNQILETFARDRADQGLGTSEADVQGQYLRDVEGDQFGIHYGDRSIMIFAAEPADEEDRRSLLEVSPDHAQVSDEDLEAAVEAAEHADGDITSEHGRELWGRRHGHFPWHRHFPHSHAPVVKAVERAASTVSRVATAAYNFARELYEAICGGGFGCAAQIPASPFPIVCTLSRSRGHGSVAASLTFADICDDGTSMRNGIRVKGLGQISVTGSGSATVERKYEGKAFKTKVGLFQVKTSAQAEISGSVKITLPWKAKFKADIYGRTASPTFEWGNPKLSGSGRVTIRVKTCLVYNMAVEMCIIAERSYSIKQYWSGWRRKCQASCSDRIGFGAGTSGGVSYSAGCSSGFNFGGFPSLPSFNKLYGRTCPTVHLNC